MQPADKPVLPQNFQMYRHTDLQSINKLETNSSAGLACNVLQFSCPYPYWSSSCPSPRLCHHFKSGGSRTVLGRAATTIRTWRAQSSSPLHHHHQQQQHDQDCSSSPGNFLLARHPTITPTPYQNSTEKLVPTLPLGFSTYSGPFLPSYESHAQHAEGPLPALELWPRQRQQGHQCQRQLQQTDAAWGAITNDKIINFLWNDPNSKRSISIHLSTAMIQYGI